jgi:uncharacterized protein with von Willebrand factor type A (vWA) domain
VVVVFSDGWERGDAAQLGEQMARLQRTGAPVVWVNPHRGKDGYEPVQQGMLAALPALRRLRRRATRCASFAEVWRWSAVRECCPS